MREMDGPAPLTNEGVTWRPPSESRCISPNDVLEVQTWLLLEQPPLPVPLCLAFSSDLKLADLPRIRRLLRKENRNMHRK
ncbi:hypothetical protein E2C01_070806 [Portunus trituberculatus]|uniref:Uncharacterized protein n=1 Tax=Portunus trituberculatus TaxID=210409 RepID=A0A5B7I373_PORTR|nr:hypothetical protein [Portunus trituberculatus]